MGFISPAKAFEVCGEISGISWGRDISSMWLERKSENSKSAGKGKVRELCVDPKVFCLSMLMLLPPWEGLWTQDLTLAGDCKG